MMKLRMQARLHIYRCSIVAIAWVLALANCGLARADEGRSDSGADTANLPSFTIQPELKEGFDLLYTQKHEEARKKFDDWESRNPTEPFGEVAIAASYLFEEFYRQGVLSSDYFLNEKKFLSGIDGKPDAATMAKFHDALTKTRDLANTRLKSNPKDPDALFALTLASGMESDAEMILLKERFDALKQLKLANEYAKQLLAVRPDANDAYVALGRRITSLGVCRWDFAFCWRLTRCTATRN